MKGKFEWFRIRLSKKLPPCRPYFSRSSNKAKLCLICTISTAFIVLKICSVSEYKVCDVQMILVYPNDSKLIQHLSETSEHETEMEFLQLVDHNHSVVLDHPGNCSKLTKEESPIRNKTKLTRNIDCSSITKELGCIEVNRNIPTLRALAKYHKELALGGYYKPLDCYRKKRVAILVSYRRRKGQLRAFLHHIHPFLQHQKLEYQIFVVQQDNESPFNRAWLFNIGYVEALKERKFDCFIFHDIDLLPEDDRNSYDCPPSPRHMSVAVDKYCYLLPSKEIFGGVTAMSTRQFDLVSGYSNSYWGWGGEDDDMYKRILFQGLEISRPTEAVGRYKMIKHEQESQNNMRFALLEQADSRFHFDGIHTLKYELIDRKHLKLFVLISVQ